MKSGTSMVALADIPDQLTRLARCDELEAILAARCEAAENAWNAYYNVERGRGEPVVLLRQRRHTPSHKLQEYERMIEAQAAFDQAKLDLAHAMGKVKSSTSRSVFNRWIDKHVDDSLPKLEEGRKLDDPELLGFYDE